MVRSMVKYGIIGGIILTFLFGIIFLTGLYLKISYFGAYLIGLLIIVAGLLMIGPAVQHEKHAHGNGIGFKQAFGIGMGVSAITAAVYGIASLIIFSLIFAAYSNGVPEGSLEFGQLPSMNSARLDELEMASMSPIYFKPWIQTVVTLTAIIPIGLLMSFVSARLTNTQP